MNRTLHYLLLFVFVMLSGSAFAQEILGTVVDQKKEPLTNASVQVKQGGILKGGAVTDFDGHYSVKPLEPGYYDVTVSLLGHQEKTIKAVIVSPGEKTGLDVTLEAGSKELKEIVVYSKPLVDKYKVNTILTAAEIAQKPTQQTEDLVALTPGIYQQQRGGQVQSDGGRTTGNVYIIDGVQVQGTIGVDISQGATEQLEVIASGIPANYGDVSGAVINLTTRGVSQKFTGNFTLQHSLDGYGNNLASFSVAGPLLRKKIADSITQKREPIMGFALSADYYYENDAYPSYYKTFVASGPTLAALRANPLTVSSTNTGAQIFNPSSDYVTTNQLSTVLRAPDDLLKEARLNGKIDFKLSDLMHITAGANIDYTSQQAFSESNVLFAPEATPVNNTFAGRAYLRFTQKLGKQGISDDTGKHIISNAYYILQVDYQKEYLLSQDPNFKQNIFDYGYIGKFNTSYTNVYFPNQQDSASGRTGTVLEFKNPNAITFTPTGMNPLLANYTSEYYRLNSENQPISLAQIQQQSALVNGDEPTSTYGLFNSPGATQAGYSISNNNQYGLSVNASFDLKAGGISHGIEFGLDYNQRIIKTFSAYSNQNGATQSLWEQMRLLVSSVANGNLVLDKNNPIFVVNGKDYTLAQVNSGVVRPSPTDTITYALINPVQSTFDKNLRAKLGLAPNQDIDIDDLSPSTFSLSMFSADELANSGNPFTSYYGYGYAGQTQNGTVNFNDYWTAKDANGNYTRPIAAFSPNMVSGYVLDKFEYKDILFNIGVRIERYSANTKVLKDPYSLYQEKTVSQSTLVNTLNGGKTPSDIPGNAVVYVDNNASSTPTVIGYRVGSNWFDPFGNAISDPSVLKNYSGGLDPQPYLVSPNVSIQDSNFNPNGSFTDYNPQVTVMPRIQISFPVSESSKFFLHYDIYSQRPYPSALGYATAYDYTYLNQNSNQIINNANLRPQQTIDYELGFQQQIGKKAALTLSGFYKERKDMITVVPYLYAWPTTYYTYGNRDFSSTKGLKANYEMRATNHLSMTIAYTLQFAEGTGSTPYSTNSGGGGQISPNGLLQSFIEAGLPNLRYVSPLDYDTRHSITASFDYAYGNGEGPVLFDNHILQNAGLDLIVKTRSGEPYTRLANANPADHTIIGGVNGSRLPWHFGTDLKLHKDFAFSMRQKSTESDKQSSVGKKAGKVHMITAYVFVQNLLQTKDVLGVYGYTGQPNNNGYLASPTGKSYIPTQINPTSYVDLYNIAYDYGNLNYARTINLGVSYHF